MAAVWGDSDPMRFFSNPVCPGAQCRWDTVATLSFCSSCEDRTGDVIFGGCNAGFNSSEVQAAVDDFVKYDCLVAGQNSSCACSFFEQQCSLRLVPENYTNYDPISISLPFFAAKADASQP